ncbi:hypothetical protein ABPG74_011373 [Tetrahymena malaccensis]
MTDFKSFYYECYCAELAKSNRSECKGCQKPIDQGALRIGHTVYFDEEHTHINKKWYHPKCLTLPEKFKNLKVWDIQDIDDLDEKYHKEIRDALKIQQGDKNKRVAHLPKVVVRQHRPVEKFEQQKALTKTQWKQYESNRQLFNKKTVKQLQDLLTKNNATVSGGKEQLVYRCALSKLLGVQPNCPSCGGQNLRFYFADGQYYCPGYLDDTDWVNCKNWFKMDEVERTEWVD